MLALVQMVVCNDDKWVSEIIRIFYILYMNNTREI